MDIQEKLTLLYQELNSAENDLSCFNVPSLDSGDENWLRDQERLINSLKEEIKLLTSNL